MGNPNGESESKQQCNLLRDIFGSAPFRSVNVNSAWLTPTVKQLAAAIYNRRFFDRMPLMADALEEAGCTSTDILNHCRQPGVHVLSLPHFSYAEQEV